MKTLRALFGLFLVVAGVYVAYKLIPPYFNNYQFQDVLETEARMNTYNPVKKSDEDLKDGIVKKAQDFDIALAPEQIKISKTDSQTLITADYTVHVDLPLYPVDLEFHPSSKNR